MLYKIGNIQIDTLNFHLSEHGDTVAIEPQVFDLIVYLIANRKRLVTRQELFDNIWSGRIVSDTSLSNHIKSARKIFGDDGKKQRVIKTVHGRGYQFIAETKELAEQSTQQKSIVEKQNDDDDKSIAVLAFSDLSPEQDQQYFSDGISEELINLLAKIPELKVISRTSSFSFKGKNKTLEKIGKLLNVTHILEGSVRKAGDQLRITTQLIQVSDESHLWSETFDRKMEHIFEIQDEIAQAVVEQLKVTLLGGMAKTTTVDPDAYTLFLEAKYLFQQFNSEAITKAEKIINDSLVIDPHYAPSWELLSQIILNATTNFFLKPKKEGLKLSKNAAQKSIDLDDKYALAYAVQALINISNWELGSASSNIDKALLLDGCNSRIINAAAIVAMSSGKIVKSIEFLRRAIELDPLKHFYYLNLGLNYLMLSQLDEAAIAAKKYGFYHPDAEIHHNLMTWVLLEQGKYKEALEEVEKEPHEFWRLFPKICVLLSLGKKQESDRLLTQFLEQYADGHPAYTAYLYAFRKENDHAFKWLDIAYQQQDPNLLEQINFSAFRNLNDPRWGVFLAKIGLPKDHWLIAGKDAAK